MRTEIKKPASLDELPDFCSLEEVQGVPSFPLNGIPHGGAGEYPQSAGRTPCDCAQGAFSPLDRQFCLL